jgi:hypothetical protein
VDILHFDGHGSFQHLTEEDVHQAPALYGGDVLRRSPKPAPRRRAVPAASPPVGIGFLLFEDAKQRSHLVSAKKLGDVLFRAQVSLVILSACESAAIDPAGDPIGSVAGRLLTTGIPAVLAMSHSVLAVTTRKLFGRFYASLARGRGIATALDDARAHLANDARKFAVRRRGGEQWLELDDWFLPTLYHAGADGALLAPATAGTPATPAAARHNLRPAHEAGFFGRRRGALGYRNLVRRPHPAPLHHRLRRPGQDRARPRSRPLAAAHRPVPPRGVRRLRPGPGRRRPGRGPRHPSPACSTSRSPTPRPPPRPWPPNPRW